ncbi:LAETG motif-containing sortase-dependent surface protein [Streptomyces sp. NPDC053048]|uniref:LAETG motif-containing sortase-dependent surface protein n=1 Tax=Streptomyces sp. NPDC053048 TaxID=3365694 RepID=UPI0037D3579D
MKLSRITAVAAAAVLAPAAFLAAPASAATDTAADSKNPAVTAPAPDERTSPQTAPTTDGGKKTDETKTKTKATIGLKNYPKSVTTGGWTEFAFTVDNTAGSETIDPLRVTFMFSGGGEKTVKSTQRIDYRSKDGSWVRIDDKTPGGTFVGQFTGGKVEKGQVATVELRVKLASDYPTGTARTMIDIWGTERHVLPEVAVVKEGGAKPTPDGSAKPTPSTGGSSAKPSPSTDASTKPTPSGKPEATPSARPSASTAPSASASSSPATAVNTSAQGGGDALATTGAGNDTPWIVGAAVVAVAAGAGLVVMTRRRLAGNR